MFNTTSKGGWGMAGFFVFGGLALMGFDIATLPNDLELVTLGQTASLVVWVWGQFARNDLMLGFIRKDSK